MNSRGELVKQGRYTKAKVVRKCFSKQFLKFSRHSQKASVLKFRFNKVAGPQSEDFLCFPVINAKLLGTAFFIEHLRWLLLGIEDIPKNNFSKIPRATCCTIQFL